MSILLQTLSNRARFLSLAVSITGLAFGISIFPLSANPLGGGVVKGNASITGQGTSTVTIQQTSSTAQINWTSFNIGTGETTTFNQPSSSSVMWNQINDSNPSQILGNLNANGYIVLQNQSGFYIGGQAVITAHGLVMTTSPIQAPNLSSGGAWQFNALPPTASIINYGQIKTDGARGGSIFLIAENVQNAVDTANNYVGTISAPQGKVGLYAGQEVLVSTRPDGRGLSAKVTLPEGSVDNEGKIIADAGTIEMHAQVVNLGGMLQANSINQANGVIELVASDSLITSSGSSISARGDASSSTASQGGFVVLKSGGTFTDTATSTIDVSGQTGGRSGVVEIFGNDVNANPLTISAVQSQIDGGSAASFSAGGGWLMINPQNITLSSSASTLLNSDNSLNPNPNLSLSDLSSFSKIDLFASGNISLNSSWSLSDSPTPAELNLAADNNINLNNSINAGQNWSVNLSSGSTILLGGNSSIYTQNGDINLWAANNVTVSGGSVSLTAQLGDITVSGGLSTQGSGLSLWAGNNVTLNGNGTLGGSASVTTQFGNISVNGSLSLSDSQTPTELSMSAGNNITLSDGSSIQAGKKGSLNLNAGTTVTSSSDISAGNAGIYLNGGGQYGGSYIQTKDGDITLWAANEVQIQDHLDAGNNGTLVNGIRTTGGGSIQVTAQFGDVNTGGNQSGFIFQNKAPYHTASSSLGGISTEAGGDVTISAGGDVRSYLPTGLVGQGLGDIGQDAGTGAFGTQPGNVTISAGGNVYGHFVLVNGVGNITAQQDVGGSVLGDNVALSLCAGSWTVNAPNGSIYLQEVRNPNGVYNNTRPPLGSKGPSPNHLFDYDPHASVTLNAGNQVQLLTTPANLPRQPNFAVPALFAPSLYINAGAGGVYLGDYVTLFPSAFGELQITTTDGGSLVGSLANAGSSINGGRPDQLMMSDSGSRNYTSATSFSASDHGLALAELNNPNPIVLNISGSIENVQMIMPKETQITVGGDFVNSAFSGQNLHPADKTTITVAGSIRNTPSFSSVILSLAPTPIAPQDLPPKVPNSFDALVNLAVNPGATANFVVPANTPRSAVLTYWNSLLAVPHQSGATGATPDKTGFAYDPATRTLSFLGPMSQNLINLLSQPTITVVRFASDGFPMVDASGHFVTDTYTWVNSGSLSTLIAESANTTTTPNNGLRIGGPGEFDIHAGSISLGDSFGILSCGAMDYAEGGFERYANLAPLTPVGATVNVTVDNNLEMLTSTIASLAGGDVNIRSTGGEIDLGAPAVLASSRFLPLGAFVTGAGGDISVSAYKDVNVDSSRIASYDGGNITITSETGNVNAGSGGATLARVDTHYIDPTTGQAASYQDGVYGSGILAVTATLVNMSKEPGSSPTPGNILVSTPQGDIIANRGGILQEALNGNLAASPTVTLIAGTVATPKNGNQTYIGNIDLGQSGVIGGTVDATANGSIKGLVISSGNSVINAGQSFSGTVLSGGSASVSASAGGVSGTIIGVGGATVSGGAGVTAQVLSQNANVNGASSSTLGTTAGPTATSTTAAGTSTTETKQFAAGETSPEDNQKKKGKGPVLTRRVGRVTVLLPGTKS